MMKKTILSLLMMTMTASVMADDYTYPYLALEESGGTVHTVSVSSLRITFSGGTLTAVNTETNEAYPLSSLSKMYFTTVASGIDVTVAPAEGPVEVFTTAGVSMGTYAGMAEARVRLPRGIYLVRQNGKTHKTTIQ